MKIIITGATGFLGLHAVKHFCQQNHTVYGLGRNRQKGKMIEEHGGHFIACSLEDQSILTDEQLASVFKDADVVIHSAALSSPWGKKEQFYQTNVIGTKHILELSVKYGIQRFIHISTPSLYFKFRDEINIPETTVLGAPFPSLYTESKYQAELLVDQYKKEHGLFTITLRPRGIFGPGDESLIPRLIKVAKANGLPTIGDGKNLIDLTYVMNVVHAMECAINARSEFNGEKYNVTNGEAVVLWDVLSNILKNLNLKKSDKKIPYKVAYSFAFAMEIIHKYLLNNKEPKLTRYTVGLLAKTQTLSIEKIKRDLGYSPRTNMETAIKLAIEDFK